MRKFISLLVVALLVFAPTVIFADDFAFDKEKVVVGAEFSAEEKNMDDVKVLDATLGSTSIKGVLAVNDLEVQTFLANVGYEFSSYFTPYILLGIANIEFDNTLSGSIGSSGAVLAATSYDEGGFAIGAGARGGIAEYKEFKLTYDARILRSDGEDNTDLTLFPGHECLEHKVKNKIDTDYTETALSLMVNREFLLRDEEGNKRVVDSVTPFAGYRLTLLDLNVKNSVDTEHIDVANETNYDEVSNDLLVGLGVKVDDNWSAKVTGVFGDSQGVGAAATYNF